jgi:hypothetical protein
MPHRALILGLLCLTAVASAQTHKVEAPEKVTRALAVYEWTGDLDKPVSARLIPVDIFINNHFEDAGVYLAHPTPLALDSGDVYSIERAGESLGTFDLDYASHLVARHTASDDAPIGVWYGFGRFLSNAEAAKLVKPAKPSKLPIIASVEADAADDKPHFIRRDSSATTTASTTTPARPGASPKDPTPAPNTPDDDPDRPTLRHRDPTDDAKKKKNPRDTGYVSGPNTSLNDDPDRPNLRRGVPTGFTTPPQLTGTPPNLHQAVAISDPANREPHLFNREWDSSTERAQTLAGLEALATPRLANYIATNKLIPIPAAAPSTASTPAQSGTPSLQTSPSQPSAAAQNGTPSLQARVSPGSGKTGALAPGKKGSAHPKSPPPILADEHLSGYTLSYGGMPTFIYTAESPVADGGPVYITLVAQRLPTGDLQLALSSITDATHLDRTPWLRPIDVVDADWSHRASLLFELRAQTSRQFALYRLVSPQAEQTFITGVIE